MNKKYKTIIKKVVPVHRHELVKFLCTAGLILLIAYIHNILHLSKDALVISHLGTESISAIKMWAVLPISLVFMFIYIKLSDGFTRSQLFHIMTWFFISYFIIFALVLYPHREALSISISEELILKLPALKHLFKIISNWSYCLFYVFSESWVTIMLLISFWQIANHITTLEESKRFYPLFAIAGGMGRMMSGVLSKVFIVEGTNWQPTLNNVVISVVIAGVSLSLGLIMLEKVIGIDVFNQKKSHFKAKIQVSFKEGLKYIVSSKPILLITSLLLCYNISLNIVEGVWKKSVEVFCGGSANGIHHFISSVDIGVSILSIIGAFVSIYILRTFKWLTSALIIPVVVFIVGVIFFLFMLLRDTSYMLALQTSAIAIAVYLGAIHNIFTRSTKNVLFDPTKEMVYIPLDDDLQTKGKAAAETIGMRFGKGGGAFIQQVLLGIFPAMTLLDLSPVLFGIFLLVLFWWFYSIVVLNRYLRG